jgi:hypothetical protein
MVLGFAATPAVATTPPTLAAPSAASADGLAQANFDWVNAQRAAAGVAPLQAQGWAQGVAAAHSVDMADSGSIYHNMTGYMAVGHGAMGATFLGENVAVGTGLDYAESALINSPPHRQNILDPRFNYVGIGAATDASGQVYVTEDFAQIGTAAAARPAAPAAPQPVAVAAPAPKPVVVAAKPVVAPRLVVAAAKLVAPKSAPAASPAPAAATPAAVANPAPAAGATPAAMSPAGHAASVNTTAVVLYTLLGLLGASFALGLGYKLTGLFPRR